MDKRKIPNWLYNEFLHSGVNYADVETARSYESRHQNFRDFDKEFLSIRQRIGLKPSDVVLDIGCGSGAFVVPASRYCKKVYGTDVSLPMLAVLREKLEAQKIKNVELSHAGFLTYQYDGQPFDAIVSSLALHHLPDFWKSVALQNISNMLKPGGIFYLFDVVFTFPIANWQDGTQKLLDEMSAAAGHEANSHISAEYSTYAWFLEGVFSRVGLNVEQTIDDAGFLRAYVCRKAEEFNPNKDVAFTCDAVRTIDQLAVEKLGVPSSILMENAGRSLADIFMANAQRLDSGKTPRRVVLCCGKGNNGGDGFVLARRLSSFGIDCRVLAYGNPQEYKGDAFLNLNILKNVLPKEKIAFLTDTSEDLTRLDSELQQCDWIVDALLGTGASGNLRKPYSQIIPVINRSSKPVYAVDLPSGLNADTGEPCSTTIRAKLTTTLAAKKIGLVADSAKEYTGELYVGDIGISIEDLLE